MVHSSRRAGFIPPPPLLFLLLGLLAAGEWCCRCSTTAFSVVPSLASRPSPLSIPLPNQQRHDLTSQRRRQRSQKTSSLFVVSEEETTTTRKTTFSTTAVVSAPPKTSNTSGAVVSTRSTKSSSSLLAKKQTMDEGIFDFNKKLIDTVYDIVCQLYPVQGTERDYVRFYVLETVARVPYFAYLSVLHLKETFGDRRMGLRMRTHYAQADNELHHLLIMEDLGGNSAWLDRTVAQTMAFGYYWYVILMFLWKEPAAYHLSELIEDHAFNTYNNFLTEHEDRLKNMPVPDIAKRYYELDNPFLFDLFCTVRDEERVNGGGGEGFSNRRPKLESLYDVFVNVRDDEQEHWKTLCNLVQYDDMNAVPASQVQSTQPTITVTKKTP